MRENLNRNRTMKKFIFSYFIFQINFLESLISNKTAKMEKRMANQDGEFEGIDESVRQRITKTQNEYSHHPKTAYF